MYIFYWNSDAVPKDGGSSRKERQFRNGSKYKGGREHLIKILRGKPFELQFSQLVSRH